MRSVICVVLLMIRRAERHSSCAGDLPTPVLNRVP